MASDNYGIALPQSKYWRPVGCPPHESLVKGSHTTIRIGQDLDHSFFIHTKLLTFHSDYFRGCLNPNNAFKEFTENRVDLHDEDPEIFELVNQWLYTGMVWSATRENCVERKWKGFVFTAMRLWVFGDKRGMPALQNAAIGVFHWCYWKTWSSLDGIDPAPMLRYVDENTMESSKLRGFVLEIVTNTMMVGTKADEWLDGLSAAILYELIRVLDRLAEEGGKHKPKDQWLASLDLCKWHVHAKDETCHSSKGNEEKKKTEEKSSNGGRERRR
ncbi:MAG: hypothetical protein M1831_005212 [Alyxoria varia]|nr:MAG: hypothetical protein M1831_005212 [Alyxoria varia]